MKIRFCWVMLLAPLVFAGCAANVSPASYSVGAIGQVNRTIGGKIISIRDVDVSGATGTGSAAGVALGATAGSAIGGGSRANLAGAIAGAVIGGIAGASIEQNASRGKATEYVVQTDNENLMTLVQGKDQSFSVGDRVLVLYG